MHGNALLTAEANEGSDWTTGGLATGSEEVVAVLPHPDDAMMAVADNARAVNRTHAITVLLLIAAIGSPPWNRAWTRDVKLQSPGAGQLWITEVVRLDAGN